MSIAEQPADVALTDPTPPDPTPPDLAPEDLPASRGQASLYRVFWRWHFYAGVSVAPVLMVLAVTGALYVFKDDLESVLYARTMFVQPQPSRVPLDDQIAAGAASLPNSYRAARVTVSSDPTRATSISFQAKDQPRREVYVNPHTGEVQGEVSGERLFSVILTIHRRLYIGTTGRVLVELTTGWTIVLLITGLYLWWPRKTEKVKGVLAPRLWAKPYVVLRDLHALAGFYLLPVALTIACTGLLYTLVWGAGYGYAAKQTSAVAEQPSSVSDPEAQPLPLDEAFAIARRHYPDAAELRLTPPAKATGALVFSARGDTGPRNQGSLALDRSTGEVLKDTPLSQASALRWWSSWNYPLHVGSVLGMPTKVIWFIACMILTALPITGLWMWWQRRPKGRTGLPRRPDVRVPWWLVGVITLLSLALPVVGLSVLLILLGEWVVQLVRRRAATPQPQAL